MQGEPIVSDTGPLISLAENCLLWILDLIENDVIIPKGVEYEAITHPLGIYKYELNALRIKEAVTTGSIIVDETPLKKEAREILSLANRLILHKKRPLTIIQEGEAEVIGLALKKGYKTLAIDERTARLLVEDVWQIENYMESRLGTELETNDKIAEIIEEKLHGLNVIRSSEIIAFAFENGLISHLADKKTMLEALLYGVKSTGCAITNDEIKEYLNALGK